MPKVKCKNCETEISFPARDTAPARCIKCGWYFDQSLNSTPAVEFQEPEITSHSLVDEVIVTTDIKPETVIDREWRIETDKQRSKNRRYRR